MRPRTIVSTVLGLLLLAAGCASSGEPNQRRGAGDVITAEELADAQVSNALQAIQRLRPQFLRQRGTTTVRNAGPEGQPTGISGQSGTELVVYVDGIRTGGIRTLEDISVDSVQEIRYVNGRDATTLYGTGHVGGVIQVRTKQ